MSLNDNSLPALGYMEPSRRSNTIHKQVSRPVDKLVEQVFTWREFLITHAGLIGSEIRHRMEQE